MADPPLGFVQGGAVRMRGLFVPVLTLALFIVAAGLLAMTHYVFVIVVNLIKGTVGRIPVIGGWFGAPASKLKRMIAHWLGRAEAAVEARIVRCFRDLATVFTRLAQDVFATAVALSALTWYVTKKVAKGAVGGRIDVLTRDTRRLKRGATKTNQRVGRLERQMHLRAPSPVKTTVVNTRRVVVREVRTIERRVIVHDRVIVQLGRVTVPRTTRRTNTRIRKLERGHARHETALRKLRKLLAPAAMAALMIATFARLGLNFLRCKNVKRAGRGVCSMDPATLEDLLLATMTVVGSVSLLELARECQDGMGIATSAIRGFVREA
jgi:hypothetical protein